MLSGGERARLAILILLLEPANLLILDEPTNHLDMRSKDVLKEAIRNFEGTVIVVSHDRDFLDGLVTQVFEFSHGRVAPHLGGIYDYLQKRRIETLAQLEEKSSQPPTIDKEVNNVQRENYQAQKEKARQQRNIERAIEKAEAKIADLENTLKAIEEAIAKGDGTSDPKLFSRYEAVQKELHQTMQEWEKTMLQLE